MYDLAKLASRVGRMGEPLPDPFPTFGLPKNRATFRRGATSLIAGHPGTFKSMAALNWLITWAKSGNTALYFSADSDETTVGRRVGGILTGRDGVTVERDMLAGRYSPYVDEFKHHLSGRVRFEYRMLSVEAMQARMESFEHAYGSYPDVVFVDNLINYSESSNDWGMMIDLQRVLDKLAREYRSHICVLHHASEGYASGMPLPRAAIQGKVTQIPRLVFTTAARGTALMICCVKNTNGPQYPAADHWMNFLVEPSMRITDLDYEEVLKAV